MKSTAQLFSRSVSAAQVDDFRGHDRALDLSRGGPFADEQQDNCFAAQEAAKMVREPPAIPWRVGTHGRNEENLRAAL
jgi:hypothetical protein